MPFFLYLFGRISIYMICYNTLTDSFFSLCNKDGETYYIVMDYCQGGSLATKIKEMSDSPQEFEVEWTYKEDNTNV